MTALTIGQTRLSMQLTPVLSGEWVEIVRPSSIYEYESREGSEFPEIKHQVEKPTMQLLRGLVEMTPIEAIDNPLTRREADGTVTLLKARLPVWHISNVRLMLGETSDGTIVEQPHADLILNPDKQEFLLSPTVPPEDYELPSVMVDDAIYSL